MTDPISDMLTRIRNASLVRKEEVVIDFSRAKLALGKILQQEGYIQEVKNVKESTSHPRGYILIRLKFNEEKAPVIHRIQKVSKPGQRVYVSHKRIPHVMQRLGTAILSTSHGIMTDREARRRKVGGELLMFIW